MINQIRSRCMGFVGLVPDARVTALEYCARALVRVVARDYAERDIVTDYLDRDPPDYVSAFRAWRALRGHGGRTWGWAL